MRKFSDEEFKMAFIVSISWAELSRKLNVSHNGSRSKAYKKLCNTLNLDYSNIKGQSWSEGRVLSNRWDLTNLDKIFVLNSEFKGGTKGLKNKILKANLLRYECKKCANKGDWFGKKLSLQLDHINGNNRDNRIENLRFLCPNCHSQTTTFAGKNNKSNLCLKKEPD
jgi:Zn finger protein HypA/HybF involved in hydrogenase expression